MRGWAVAQFLRKKVFQDFYSQILRCTYVFSPQSIHSCLLGMTSQDEVDEWRLFQPNYTCCGWIRLCICWMICWCWIASFVLQNVVNIHEWNRNYGHKQSPNHSIPFAYSADAMHSSSWSPHFPYSTWPPLPPRTFPTFRHLHKYSLSDCRNSHQDGDNVYLGCGCGIVDTLSCLCEDIFLCNRCRICVGILWLCGCFWCRIDILSSEIQEREPRVR